MTLLELPLVCGLMLGSLGPGINNPLGYPYCGVSSPEYHRLSIQVGGTSMHVATSSDMRMRSPTAGGFESWHWRTEMLVGLGLSLTKDIFFSIGDAIGEGQRLYTSVGIKFYLVKPANKEAK